MTVRDLLKVINLKIQNVAILQVIGDDLGYTIVWDSETNENVISTDLLNQKVRSVMAADFEDYNYPTIEIYL